MNGELNDFLEYLDNIEPNGSVVNPYRGYVEGIDAFAEACAFRTDHLRAYLALRLQTARLLLVAEAPGYQGARFSGIAMTCERTITGGKHWITAENVLGPGAAGARTSHIDAGRNATERLRGFCEPTATIVWGELVRRQALDQVVLWNAFPFHPHAPERPLQNRTPTPAEVDAHHQVLHRLRALLPAETAVVAVGNTARDFLARQGVEALHVRHPANGGAPEFKTGINEALDQLPPAEM